MQRFTEERGEINIDIEGLYESRREGGGRRGWMYREEKKGMRGGRRRLSKRSRRTHLREAGPAEDDE